MHAVKKYAIIAGLVMVAGVGAWTYACCANVPWLSDMARCATHNVALSMGLHVFDPAPGAVGTDAKKETVANLPEGYYIYAGEKPTHSAIKWVVVNPGGTIQWVNTDPAPARAAAVPGLPAAPDSAGAAGAKGEWEDYSYPTIKWKAKPLPHVEGGAAQLQTTYETGASGPPGSVKYQLTVMKDSSKRGRKVQLLDKDGFKIFDFAVSDWQDVPGSNDFIQARDSFPMAEEDYRRVRDYCVN